MEAGRPKPRPPVGRPKQRKPPPPATDPLYAYMGNVGWDTEGASETSAAAALAMSEDRLTELEELVFHAIEAAGLITCDALEQRLGLQHQTCSARVRGLVLRKRIINSGKKGTTRRGRKAVLWRVRTAEDDKELNHDTK